MIMVTNIQYGQIVASGTKSMHGMIPIQAKLLAHNI